LLNYIAVYGILFLFPFYLIEVRGLGPARAGLLLTVQPLVMTVAAPLSGIASDRIGTRTPTTLGMALLAAGSSRRRCGARRSPARSPPLSTRGSSPPP